jgi:hypothetical protein
MRSFAEVTEMGVQLLLSAVEHRFIHHMVRLPSGQDQHMRLPAVLYKVAGFVCRG